MNTKTDIWKPAASAKATGTLQAPQKRGVPIVVDVAAQLAAQPVGQGPEWTDSIYMAGQLEGEGHRFGFVVHVLVRPEQNLCRQVVTLTDAGTGWFKTDAVMPPPGTYTWFHDRLDLRTADLRWTGDAERQRIVAETPWGALDLGFEAEGPALYYAGTGSFDWLGIPQNQFALPQLRTTGTLTIDGVKRKVSGESWLDRQWGPSLDLIANRWTWMNLSMPDGDKVALWNVRSADGKGREDSWATVLRPNGNHELVAVTPVAEGAGRMWHSATSEYVFPTEWNIAIPALDARLRVTTTSEAQELPGIGMSIYEGAAVFSGTYRGRPATGRTYVEQVGNWNP